MFGGRRRSRTPSLLREPGFQGQSQDHPRCIIFHIETHYALTIKLTTSTHDMVIVMGSNHHLNVFLYGWGTLNRTRTGEFKAHCTTTMLYPNKLQQIFNEQTRVYIRNDPLSSWLL